MISFKEFKELIKNVDDSACFMIDNKIMNVSTDVSKIIIVHEKCCVSGIEKTSIIIK